MNTKPQAQLSNIKRIREILVWSFIVLGLLLILISFLIPSGGIQDIVRSLGLSLAPAGVVTLVLSRYAASITEILLREAVETTIRDRLQEDMKRLDSTVGSGMQNIAATVSDGVQNIAVTVSDGVDEIEQDMKGLSPLFAAASKLGLENVHLTRATALASFAWFLDAEAQKAERGEPARVWIVSSSIKGFLDATAEQFDGRTMMETIARCGCELRIMMTHPEVADLRAKQEQRAAGEIPSEVEMNLAYLKRIGVPRESVRYYSGTPTVFAIATTDRMLLNPYPYQTEAFRCFSVIVKKTLNPRSDIYHQYLRYHFEEPWQSTVEIPLHEWNEL